MWCDKQPISYLGMLIMSTPILSPYEFQSNFLLMNIESVTFQTNSFGMQGKTRGNIVDTPCKFIQVC
jgi:hypothetical protein